MTSKTAKTSSSLASANDAFSDLEQLRLIVFGQAKQELDAKIDDLQQRISSELEEMHVHFNEKHQALNKQLEDNQAEFIQQLNISDDNQQATKASLEASIESVSAQLEMAENASKDDFDEVHKRIDQEVNRLDGSLKDAIEALSAKLDAMNNNLATSKTDRKILAKLLANVATNLDADD